LKTTWIHGAIDRLCVPSRKRKIKKKKKKRRKEDKKEESKKKSHLCDYVGEKREDLYKEKGGKNEK